MDEEEIPTASLGVWIGLSLIACVSFWCQAIVTEERFVPALNVIADHFNIPDDIAGATLMAAGASSPELFSSFVSLFVTHSALGLGTIVGSEIFNQLIICAGAVYASKTGKLQLDRAIVTREVGFYALAIALLYYALQDHRPLESDPDGPDHIFISFHEACFVFGGYIAYVVVCANMEAIVAFVTNSHRQIRDKLSGEVISYGAIGSKSSRKAIEVPKMPFMTKKTVLSKEPASNWNSVEIYVPANQTSATPLNSFGDEPEGEGDFREQGQFSRSSRMGSSMLQSFRQSLNGVGLPQMMSFIQHSERPGDVHSMHDLELNALERRMSCFLWQRSFFYTKAYYAKHGWHLRWFTITPRKIMSIPDRQNAEKHRMNYPSFKEIEVDDDRLIIKIINPDPEKRDYTLMAPSKAVFEHVVEAFELFMEGHLKDAIAATDSSRAIEINEFESSDDHVGLIEYPSDGSYLGVAFWLFLYPLRFLMHCTMPDVRQLDRNGEPMNTIRYAYFAAVMCLVWLIIGSYAMVASLEALAALMNVPTALVGVTVSAAGTSLPNYIASKVAAENGFGNQAVSNAFGSNTFNIMVGLGLPWVLYTSFGTHFKPYDGLRDDGITQAIVILASVLLVFVVLMFQTNFVIYKWHGVLFVLMYVAYIAFSIAQALFY